MDKLQWENLRVIMYKNKSINFQNKHFVKIFMNLFHYLIMPDLT